LKGSNISDIQNKIDTITNLIRFGARTPENYPDETASGKWAEKCIHSFLNKAAAQCRILVTKLVCGWNASPHNCENRLPVKSSMANSAQIRNYDIFGILEGFLVGRFLGSN